jgi:hypothetical protein
VRVWRRMMEHRIIIAKKKFSKEFSNVNFITEDNKYDAVATPNAFKKFPLFHDRWWNDGYKIRVPLLGNFGLSHCYNNINNRSGDVVTLFLLLSHRYVDEQSRSAYFDRKR